MSHVDRIIRKYDFPFAPKPEQRSVIDAHVDDCIDHVGLYWGMGSGKTFSSTLHSCIYREQTGAQTLQFVPPVLLKQWSKWLTACGISNKVYAGTKKQRAEMSFDTNTQYFIMSIDVLKNDFDRIFGEVHKRKLLVNVDEAMSIKNYESGNFRAILQLSTGQAIVPMTGTPIATPRDAYAYIKLVSPGTYRSYTQFENIHVKERDFFGTVTEWQNLDVLKKNLANRASFVSTPEANPDMPRANISEIPYDLASKHLKLYKTIMEKQLVVFEDGAALDATTPQKLRHMLQQVIWNYGYFAQQNELTPAGFDIVDEMLSEIGRQKMIIVANYKMSVKAVTEYLVRKGVNCAQVNGDVGEMEKGDNIDRFKEDPDCQVLVMNPASGGIGVDGLQHVCHIMLFLELPPVAKFWQAVTRIERPGQKFEPDVRIATALGTVQVYMRTQLVVKDELVNTVVPSLNDLRKQLLGEA